MRSFCCCYRKFYCNPETNHPSLSDFIAFWSFIIAVVLAISSAIAYFTLGVAWPEFQSVFLLFGGSSAAVKSVKNFSGGSSPTTTTYQYPGDKK